MSITSCLENAVTVCSRHDDIEISQFSIPVNTAVCLQLALSTCCSWMLFVTTVTNTLHHNLCWLHHLPIPATDVKHSANSLCFTIISHRITCDVLHS